MDTRRQLKMGSVIQEAFTGILSRDGRGIYGKAFVTVTHVKVTSDLGLVRFNLSIFNAENPEEVLQKFNEHKFELKRKLAEQLRHQLRVMPEIEFFRDETLEYALHIDEVFKKIKEEDAKLEIGVQNAELNAKSQKPNLKAKVGRARKTK